jgi:hypothetical protein
MHLFRAVFLDQKMYIDSCCSCWNFTTIGLRYQFLKFKLLYAPLSTMMLPTSTHRTAFGWLCSSFRLFWGFNVVSFVLFSIASASPTLHDASFVPDRILRVTSGTHTQSCITKSGVGFVNGSSPGPEVRIMEGQTTWIRVYNDMVDQNLTMVRTEL